jgi:dUTP pyrophosphatase
MIKVKFKKLHQNATRPSRAYQSAGYDLFPVGNGIVPVLRKVIIPLGFATEFSPDYVALIQDRGSTGMRGIIRLAGVVDGDFRNEWKVILFNSGPDFLAFGPDKAVA